MIQDFISKLSEKEKKFLYITVAIVFVALLDLLFLRPVVDKIGSLDTEISQQRGIVEGDLKFLSHRDKIIQRSEAYSQFYVESIDDDDVVNADFLRAVEKLATQSKVNLIKSNPTESEDLKDYRKYYANLDLSGNLSDVISFMHSVNSTDDLLKIVKFNMNPKRGEDDQVNASMTIVKMLMTGQ